MYMYDLFLHVLLNLSTFDIKNVKTFTQVLFISVTLTFYKAIFYTLSLLLLKHHHLWVRVTTLVGSLCVQEWISR